MKEAIKMEETRQETPEQGQEELTEQQIEERLRDAVKKKRGAPPGNQNARTHGFYSRVLPASERKHYEETVQIEGLDEEIAVMRIKLKSLVRSKPAEIMLITRAANSLTRMINARNRLAAKAKPGGTDPVLSVLNEIAIPAGISLTDFFKK
jgi:hypothetical protein